MTKNVIFSITNIYIVRQILGCVAGSLVCLSAGMGLGFSGMVLPELVKDDTITYDKSYDSWVASIIGLSAIFGGLFIGPLLDGFGRKYAFVLTIFPFITGWLLMAFAKTIVLILIGRFLIGLCYGATKIVSLVYVGEIFNAKFRATALLLMSLWTNIGVLVYHLIVYYIYWRTSCLLCIVPIIIAFVIILLLKESPLWFIMKGRIDEGTQSFMWFRGNDNVSQQELQHVLREQTYNTTLTLRTIIGLVLNKTFVKPLITVVLLTTCVQFSGVNTISLYVTDIVKETFPGITDTFSIIMAIDTARFMSGLILCFWGNILPRKINFLCGSFSTSGLLIYLIIIMYLKATWTWALIVGMVLYMCMSSYILSLSWSFLPELFPGKVRGFGSGLGSAVSFTMLFACAKLSPFLLYVMGKEVMYGVLCGITLFCSIFLSFLLPETNRKTLQEIEDSYATDKPIVHISKL